MEGFKADLELLNYFNVDLDDIKECILCENGDNIGVCPVDQYLRDLSFAEVTNISGILE